jgi:hypothetical protein
MKTNLFAMLAATALLTATSAFAAPTPAPANNHDGRYQQGPGDRNHRVSPQERARYEAQQRNDYRDDDHRDNKFDRNQKYGFERNHKATPAERRSWEQNHNYGYAQNQRVTPQERTRWEAQYRRR